MMVLVVLIIILSTYVQHSNGYASKKDYDFRVLVCGPYGGALASGLTTFLLSEKVTTGPKPEDRSDKNIFLSLDAGTGFDCLEKVPDGIWDDTHDALLDAAGFGAQEKDNLGQYQTKIGYFKQEQIGGFLITHSHFDHIAGLVIGSADDKIEQFTEKQLTDTKGGKLVIAAKKDIKGIKDALKEPLWPVNLWYDLKDIPFDDVHKSLKGFESSKSTKYFENSKMEIKAYKLKHGDDGPVDRGVDVAKKDVHATAYLICHVLSQSLEDKIEDKNCIAFFGDTGPDKVVTLVEEEGDDKGKIKKTGSGVGKSALSDDGLLARVWGDLAGLFKRGELNTIFIECSYADPLIPDRGDDELDDYQWKIKPRSDKLLFGHLTPFYLTQELLVLAERVKGAKGKKYFTKQTLNVVVIHQKPSYKTGSITTDKSNTDATRKKIMDQLNILKEVYLAEKN